MFGFSKLNNNSLLGEEKLKLTDLNVEGSLQVDQNQIVIQNPNLTLPDDISVNSITEKTLGNGVRVEVLKILDNTISAVVLNNSINIQPNGIGIVSVSSNLDLTGGVYSIDATEVLSSDTLGANVLSSSLTSVGLLTDLQLAEYDFTGDTITATNDMILAAGGKILPQVSINMSGGTDYEINSNIVLSETVLGAGVLASSLTSLGIIDSLNAGNININQDTILNAASSIIYDAFTDHQTLVDGNLVMTASITGLDLNALNISNINVLTASSVAATITLAAQPFITSLGTLSTLNVGTLSMTSNVFSSSGNMQIDNPIANQIIITFGNITEAFFDVSGLNLSAGNVYSIGGTSVLSSTVLGVNVVNSSLTSLGTLTTLNIGTMNLAGKIIKMINDNTDITLIGSNTVADSSQIVISGTAHPTTPNRIDYAALDHLFRTENGAIIGTFSGANGLDLSLGTYKIGAIEVLSSTVLGTNVVSSSLTSLGTITSLNVGSMNMAGNLIKMASLDTSAITITGSSSVVDTAQIIIFGSANVSPNIIQYKSGSHRFRSSTGVDQTFISSSGIDMKLGSLVVSGFAILDQARALNNITNLTVDNININADTVSNTVASLVLSGSGLVEIKSGATALASFSSTTGVNLQRTPIRINAEGSAAILDNLKIDSTDGGRVFRETSSKRYKKKIKYMKPCKKKDSDYDDDSPSEMNKELCMKILSLSPCTYYPKTGPGKDKKVYGLIAEDVEEFLPEMCTYDKDGKVNSLSYARMVVPLICAIKELAARVISLQKRMEDH